MTTIIRAKFNEPVPWAALDSNRGRYVRIQIKDADRRVEYFGILHKFVRRWCLRERSGDRIHTFTARHLKEFEVLPS